VTGGERCPRSALQILLERDRLLLTVELDGDDDTPRAIARGMRRSAGVVCIESGPDIVCGARIKPPRVPLTLENVNEPLIAHGALRSKRRAGKTVAASEDLSGSNDELRRNCQELLAAKRQELQSTFAAAPLRWTPFAVACHP
jgi:hypothetical protein